jgi:hypothetical protein
LNELSSQNGAWPVRQQNRIIASKLDDSDATKEKIGREGGNKS